jgi:type VI secretion system protein ImpG
MQAKYYQDELAWLREMGRELADVRPELARYLGEPGADPDVERMLEGFAFLTGRIREKLDDEFPELTHGLLDMLCPHYLRPIPSMAILQVRAKPGSQAGLKLPRGAVVESIAVDGTRCRFRTVAELDPAPLDLIDADLKPGHPNILRLRFHANGRPLGSRAIRFHLGGEPTAARALFVLLCHYRGRCLVRSLAPDSRPLELELRIQPGGLAETEAALPMPSGAFHGFRLLQEYFAFPERFLFVDILGLDRIPQGYQDFELLMEFRELPEQMPAVTTANLLLDCVPVVNLFAHDADPIRAEKGRSEYRIRPAGADPGHYEVHSVTAVVGRVRGSADVQEYQPFFAFGPQDRSAGRFYQLRRSESLRGAGSDLFLRLGSQDPAKWSDLDTISLDLLCSNRDLPTRLGPGDILKPAPETSTAFNYRNLGTPTPPIPTPLGDEVYWRLLAHMTLNLRRIGDRESFCTMLALYDFRSRVDRQSRRRLENLIQSIGDVKLHRDQELLDGVPINGNRLELSINEEKAGGDGEVYLLGSVLNELLAQYVSLNSFCRLQIHCTTNNEVFRWPARVGRRISL